MVEKKYFYTDGVEKFGPFSYRELKSKNLPREMNIWYYGLESWMPLSEIEEFDVDLKQAPNEFKPSKTPDIYRKNKIQGSISSKKYARNELNSGHKFNKVIPVFIIIILLIVVSFYTNNNSKENKLYQEISSSAYDADVDFDFYVKKFYRDLEVFGIFPKKPKTTIIKFAKFDHITDATHFHGVSCGVYDDDIIEIYINPSTWENFNKPKRYYLMYHELSHDVLNVKDLSDTPDNYGKLMYPILTSYESVTRDEVIEGSHELFDEVAAKQNY